MDKNFKTLKIQITGELFKYLLLCMCDKFFFIEVSAKYFHNVCEIYKKL